MKSLSLKGRLPVLIGVGALAGGLGAVGFFFRRFPVADAGAEVLRVANLLIAGVVILLGVVLHRLGSCRLLSAKPVPVRRLHFHEATTHRLAWERRCPRSLR